MIELLLAGGGGAVMGSVITKAIEAVMGRQNRKADAAKALTDATTQFTKAVTELNINLHKEIVLLKRAILTLTDTVDEILPFIEGLTDEQRKRLRDANNAAKLVL